MDLKWREEIRLFELETVFTELGKVRLGKRTILEVGAGAGWQAKKLAEGGEIVEAIDIQNSTYAENRVWPILEYDGVHIPFPDDHFDIVFSSNVLQHVVHLAELQEEMKRVLRPDGVAIHVLPSGTWRFWTNATHYVFISRVLWNRFFHKVKSQSPSASPVARHSSTQACPSEKKGRIRGLILPTRLGERGSFLSELYSFSRPGWGLAFRKGGWVIRTHFSNRLFYTGYSILGSALTIKSRRLLSRFLGSSCHIFFLGKQLPDELRTDEAGITVPREYQST